jgi:DNA polymerase-1
MENNKVLAKMELRGIRYDLKQLWKEDEKYKKKGERLLVKALQLDGIDQTEKHFNQRFNPKSYVQLKYLLLEHYGLPIITKTDKGAPSIDQKTMGEYAKKPYSNPYCKLMDQYRSYETLRSSFLSGVVPKLIGDIGHTNYSLHATTTGRPASVSPNILNLPRDKDIKKIFIPRDGYIFLYFDLAQVEVRVAAVIYYDKNLIEICNTDGKDFHSMIASKIYHTSYDDFYKAYKDEDPVITEKRVAAKSVTFGILYQQGADGLSDALNIEKNKAQSFIDEYFAGFPDLYNCIEQTKKFVIENKYVESYFGFRRRWSGTTEDSKEMLREAVNHRIQSTAWQISQLIQIQVDNFIEKNNLDAYLIMQTYDSILLEIKEKDIQTFSSEIVNIVENVNKPYPILNEVKIKADIEISISDLSNLFKVKY